MQIRHCRNAEGRLPSTGPCTGLKYGDIGPRDAAIANHECGRRQGSDTRADKINLPWAINHEIAFVRTELEL
jgi:hypothetical protein